MILRCLRCARRLWHCRLYHDWDFCRQLLGGVGFAEGVTMGHQLLVQLESIAITIVWSGVVAFIGYKLGGSDGWPTCAGRTRARRLDVNSHGENAYNA